MNQISLKKSAPIVLSVGGSLIVPNGGPNITFLKSFKKFIDKEVANGKRFVIVTGGGKTARHYIDAASAVSAIDAEDLDWIGIHATRLNGHLLRTLFREYAHPVVVKNPPRCPKKWSGKVLIAAGWKPGWSTDYVASRLAKRLGAEIVVNLSDISHVYEEDPRKNPEAKPLNEMTWKTYRTMVGDTWHPGKSAPFDPVASRFSHRHKINVVIASGADLANLGKIINEKPFSGTIIR